LIVYRAGAAGAAAPPNLAQMLDFDAFCLECGALCGASPDCAECGARRIARHPELASLEIAHIDCDAFYAAVEKRDDPTLADRPVIVGGGVRGVVTTCCYVARTFGVRSAMPMFEALKACPEAVVIKPDFRKYAEAGRAVRARMEALTPLVEPLSIDEAFLDLAGTRRLLKMAPAQALATLQREIRRDLGITVSIGLAPNKFLAKLASDLDKPSGFSVIGRYDAKARLAPMPVTAIWGVGPAFAASLARDGLRTIGDLQRCDATGLARRYGDQGLRLARLAQGEDARAVRPDRETKSVSAETTFNEDLSALDDLEDALLPLAERVAARMREKALCGRTITLKLKTSDFETITRRETLDRPSALARTAFDTACGLLKAEANGRSFRLIGVGYSGLAPAAEAAQSELFERGDERYAREEEAIDAIRKKFGANSIALGRAIARRARRS
jgi:DNA polymerase-4